MLPTMMATLTIMAVAVDSAATITAVRARELDSERAPSIEATPKTRSSGRDDRRTHATEAWGTSIVAEAISPRAAA